MRIVARKCNICQLNTPCFAYLGRGFDFEVQRVVLTYRDWCGVGGTAGGPLTPPSTAGEPPTLLGMAGRMPTPLVLRLRMDTDGGDADEFDRINPALGGTFGRLTGFMR